MLGTLGSFFGTKLLCDQNFIYQKHFDRDKIENLCQVGMSVMYGVMSWHYRKTRVARTLTILSPSGEPCLTPRTRMGIGMCWPSTDLIGQFQFLIGPKAKRWHFHDSLSGLLYSYEFPSNHKKFMSILANQFAGCEASIQLISPPPAEGHAWFISLNYGRCLTARLL